MSFVTHVFKKLQRWDNGRLVSDDNILRRANFQYDFTGNNVEITIESSLSTKQAYLTKQEFFTLYYQGKDKDYRFELECWPDNGTIKRLSVFRLDTGVEYRYISDHQDRLF